MWSCGLIVNMMVIKWIYVDIFGVSDRKGQKMRIDSPKRVS